MTKLTLSDPENLINSSAIATLAANHRAIETAIDNTLSRDGTSPNQMEADIDMNSNRITNLPAASTAAEPVRKAEFDAAVFSIIHSDSSTSLTIGTGTKTFEVDAGDSFVVGMFVLAVDASDASNFMSGQVTSYSGGDLEVDVTTTGGSGTIDDWDVYISGAPGSNGTNGTNGNDGADGAVWYSGAIDPDNGDGADGDFYLQTGTGATGVLGDVWTKAAGAWSIESNIRGPAGSGLADVVDDTTPQLGGDLDASGNDIQFDDATGIRDDSDNEQLIFQKTASAVNHIEITNAATANAPSVAAAGDDANVNLNLLPKGSGIVTVSGNRVAAIADPNADRVLIWDDSAGDYVGATLNNGIEISGTTLRALETICIALSDETTAITTGTNKATVALPLAFTVVSVFACLNTVSSSGVVTVDINESSVSILSTKLTIDANELTSGTAAAAAVISDSSLAANTLIQFDIDTAGTGAKGLKVILRGYWT